MHLDKVQTLEASVTTVSVDIRVIRIGSKQMTLAVFRQLERLPIIDRHGRLRAKPWGWVNYDAEGGKTAVVFSMGGKIYRDDVWNATAIKIERSKPYTDYSTKETVPERWEVVAMQDSGFSRRWTFQVESEAQIYRANRIESVFSILESDQLFIAV